VSHWIGSLPVVTAAAVPSASVSQRPAPAARPQQDEKNTSVRKMPNSVTPIMPLNTAVPSDWRTSAPAPAASTRGTTLRMNANEVMIDDRPRGGAGDSEVQLPGAARRLGLSQRRRLQRRPHLRPTVRVRREIDLRRFPSIPRAAKLFERLYKGRTSAERVNGRLKIFWGIDDGRVDGSRRFHAHVGAVLIVHLGLATVLARAERYEGTYGTMRLSPIAQALRDRMK
jgi:hypothetical protein